MVFRTGKSNEVVIESPITDTISELQFSPQSNFLAAASWDNQVRIWDVDYTQAKPVTAITHEGPALCCTWSMDGKYMVSGGADTFGRMVDMDSGSNMLVAKHDEPIRNVRFVALNGQPILVTGSWDKTIKYWDLRQQKPLGSVDIQQKCYAMDARGDCIVIATANRMIHYIDAKNPQFIMKTFLSPLKYQTKSLAISPDAKCTAIGSVEGRFALEYFADSNKEWIEGTPTCVAYHSNGERLAYALGNDWTQEKKIGVRGSPTRIVVHKLNRIQQGL
ncbi:hypothetical protein H4219_000142 [Mycoemilia scoparia]|uniref:Uncharacterized protein n=1 Tax=Mycoemilia scoparia TaxID=417184 RepID=A0A9W8A414_9FUNG|nr:hypothetical protein H4219_000142 [Mycoemilia scoparia]